MMVNTIQLLVNFFQMLIIYITLDLFYKRRFRFKYSVEIVIVVTTAFLSLINYNFSISTNMKLYFAYYLFLIILNIIIFEGNPFSKIFTCLVMVGFIGISELISVALIIVITKIDISEINNNGTGRYLAVFLSQILIFFIYTIMKKRANKDKMNLNNNIYYIMIGSILFLTVAVVLSVIWIYGNLPDISDEIKDMMVLLTLCVSLLSLISIAMSTKIINDMEEKHKLDLELQHIKFEQEYFSDVNSALDDLRILKHDMRGELAIIHGYNEMNQRDKIRNHIEKKLSEMDVQLIPKMDNDNIITSFLNFKLKEAKINDISFEIKSGLTEENKINIDKEDICRILNNVINNAIEACNKCEEKYIKLSLDMIDKCLIIKSENPYKGEIKKVGHHILTIKKDKTNHGYGLKSIKGIVEKYGGNVNINYDNNVFNIEVHMLVNSRQTANIVLA